MPEPGQTTSILFIYYQALRKICTDKIKRYLTLMLYAQRIAYRFTYIAAVDVRTITISL